MAQAAQIGSTSDHAGGSLTGAGVPTVTIESLPAAVANSGTTVHNCNIKPSPPHVPTSPITSGSATVLIGGMAAARVNDHAGCGATILHGATNVFIGG